MGFSKHLCLLGQAIAFALNSSSVFDNVSYNIPNERVKIKTKAGVTNYRGVRYAKPNPRRWAAPEPYEGDMNHAIANKDDSWTQCPQGHWDYDRQREDCLFMNIYKPDNAKDLPIFIWIHGGHFRNGGADFYDGWRLTSTEEIVYVSINYRLGAFGFLYMPDTDAEGNYGLMDQQLAIKFIYDYAHQIGGDRNRITIAGESAGSISVSLQMLNPNTAQYVQNVIPMSGPPNLMSEPQWTNQNGPDSLNGFCLYNSELGCPGGSTQAKLDHLRGLFSKDASTKIHGWISNYLSIGAVAGGPFWEGVGHPIQLAESGNFKKVPMMIGFTSYEGSLEEASYPNIYNKDNVISAYGNLGPSSYAECLNYPYSTKQILVERLYQRMACRYNFPANQADMSDDDGIKMALSIYGDVTFRSPSVRHAELYRQHGANAWVYNFDTDEHTTGNQLLEGAAHAAELKYLFSWGNVHRPWQSKIQDFFVTSWRNFAIHGHPGIGTEYESVWTQYDGDEGHTEIENTETEGIIRYDSRFDFDLLVGLDLNDLDDVYTGSCATTVVTTTTQRPANYCEKFFVDGSASKIYGFNGEFIKKGEYNGFMTWEKKHGHNQWCYMGNDGKWSFAYGVGSDHTRVIWKAKGPEGCPAHAQGNWFYWTGQVVAEADASKFWITDPNPPPTTPTTTTAGPTTTPNTPTTTGATPATTTPTGTTAATTPGTTANPDNCDIFYLSGSKSKLIPDLHAAGVFIATGAILNGAKVYKRDEHNESVTMWMYLWSDGYWHVWNENQGADAIIFIEHTVNCPAQEPGMWMYYNPDTEGLDTAANLDELAVQLPASVANCDYLAISGSKTNLNADFDTSGDYAIQATQHNGAPVWKKEASGNTPEMFVYLHVNGWFHVFSTFGHDAVVFIERTRQADECPGRESANWLYWDPNTEAIVTSNGPQEISVVVQSGTTTTGGPTTTAMTTKADPNCNILHVSGSKTELNYNTAGVYTWFGDTHNGARVWQRLTNPEIPTSTYIYLHSNNYWHIYDQNSGTDAWVWIERKDDSLCPGREGELWYYWNPDSSSAMQAANLNEIAVEIPGAVTDCDEIEVSGSKTNLLGSSDDLFGSGLYQIQSQTHNGAPIWKKGGDQDMYIYLHHNGWWQFFSEPQGEHSILFQKRTYSGNGCPASEQANWYYWDPDLSQVVQATGSSEILVSLKQPPTTTTKATTTTTVPTTTAPPKSTTTTTILPSTVKTTTTTTITHSTTTTASTTRPKDDKCDPANLPEGVVIVDEGKGKNADGTWGADGYMSASCSDGFVDSMNKPKVKHTCKCNADGCMFVPAKAEWKCIDQSICPLPFWGGNKFSYVKFVEDEWSMLKARFKPDPDFETTKFWKTADWTAVVVCNQDLRKDDGSADGVMALEMYPRSHSADGRAWTLVNRPGFYITKRDKGSYYKIMIDSPQEKFPWTVGKTGQKTCWIGVLHGHWPNLAECLGENYANNGLRCSSCW